MFIYVVTFFISCLLLWISEKMNHKKYKKIIILFALITPCLLAGLRSTSIGTDVNVYVKQLFECSKNSSGFIDYLNSGWNISWKIFYVHNIELGFTFLVFVIQKIFNNFQLLLFIIQCLIIFPLYFSLKKFDILKGKIWFCFFIFYCLFFNVTLNAMRQFIGISIAFYGLSSLFNDGKMKNYIICLIIGMFFHTSTIISLIICAFYYILVKKDIKIILSHKSNVRFSRIAIFFVVALTLLICFNVNLLTYFLKILNLEQYNGYISGSYKFSLNKIIIKLPIFCLFILSYKNLKKDKKCIFYIFILIFDFITSNFSSFSTYGDRIRYMFTYFLIILIPIFIENIKNKHFVITLTLIGLFIYWYYFIVICGYNSTIPYNFFWQEVI